MLAQKQQVGQAKAQVSFWGSIKARRGNAGFVLDQAALGQSCYDQPTGTKPPSYRGGAVMSLVNMAGCYVRLVTQSNTGRGKDEAEPCRHVSLVGTCKDEAKPCRHASWVGTCVKEVSRPLLNRTGPKISSRHTFICGATPVSTVGATKKPV